MNDDRKQAAMEREQALAALRESEERFRTMADTAPVLLWVSGTDGLCNFFNQVWLSFTGRTLEQEKGNGWAEGVHPDDRAGCLETYWAAFNARQPFEMEYRLRRADGEYRWIVDRAAPRFAGDGAFAGYIGSCIDITERKQTEVALQERAEQLTRLTADLARRNQELDQFAYVVSHDLKAPLRAIANLSEWLEEDLEPALTEETRHQMDLLRGRVHRMEALIEGLLQYSRVGRVAATSERVAVEPLLRDVIDSLAPPPGFEVTIGAGMPILVTERLALQQVFSNLISNAIKHHRGERGQIAITVHPLEHFYEFAVRDNGPGIAPQFHQKIFGIFQTLEARDKVESTGIGLSLVKKIVEGKGGTVWVESRLGQGATFFFTWPG